MPPLRPLTMGTRNNNSKQHHDDTGYWPLSVLSFGWGLPFRRFVLSPSADVVTAAAAFWGGTEQRLLLLLLLFDRRDR